VVGPGGERVASEGKLPVKVSASGNGVVKPSVRVPRKRRSGLLLDRFKPKGAGRHVDKVRDSGSGQQVTLSMVPGGQCPDWTGLAKLVSRVL